MIPRLLKVTNDLYRGGQPSPKDVMNLKKRLGINKIVSLDEVSGRRISNICKILNIKHIILPIKLDNFIPSLIKFLSQDLKKLFLEDGPTFVHCAAGKDRTGLAVALVECKYLNKNPEQAIKEAKDLGFGVGIDPKITNIFEKLIRSCQQDVSHADDIVSNQREYKQDGRDSYLDEAANKSIAPFLDVTQTYPQGYYNETLDQSPTRQNYNAIPIMLDDKKSVPMVGVYNNDAGIKGGGPVEPMPGGFIYD